MKKLIRLSLMCAAAASVALVGCGKKQNENAAPHGAAETKPASNETKPAASTPSASSAQPTQETAEGTVALFVQSLRDGDYTVAAALADPTSVGASTLKDLAEAMDKLAQSTDPQHKSAEELIRSMYTPPWQDVKTTLSSVREDRARYTFTFNNGHTVDVDVVKNEGLWRVFVPEHLLDIGHQPKRTLDDLRPTPQGDEESQDEGEDESEG